MKLIFGLGNPGAQYAQTRHNAGFMALDALAALLHTQVQQKKRGALVADTRIGQEKTLLIKPQTFMNNSGACVLDFAAYYKVELADIIVLYNDIDLPVGIVRVRAKGGPGTHNGMRDIVAHLGETGFPRVRIGVGAKPPQWDLVDHVLGKPEGEDWERLTEGVERAARATLCLVERGVDAAQQLNGKEPHETNHKEQK